MRGNLISLVVSLLFLVGLAGNAIAVEYDHETEVRGMTFSWKVADGNLHIKLMGRTTGWVGIGFNATDKMKDGNFILGYVKDGKAQIIDDYGVSKNAHKDDEKMGGTDNATLIGGTEKDGRTTIEFSIPLNSGDKMDTVIDPAGETVILLAYGGSRDSFISKHKSYCTFLPICCLNCV